MKDLFKDMITAARPKFVPVEVSTPITVSSIRKWNEGTFSVWLLGPENKDGSLNIVYGVNQAQN